jgi:hypothetical protein
LKGRASRTAALLGAVLLVSAAAEAGPWAVGRGHYYSKLSYQHRRSTTLATPDGTLLEIPVFTQQDAVAYLAYGVRSWLTVTADLPFLRSSNLPDMPDELPRVTGIGDMRFGAQVQLGRTGPWVFAVRGLVQAPTGDETSGLGLLPTGSGAWEGATYVGAGQSFASGRGYGFAELGYHLRGSGLRDGFLYEAQVGWNVTSRVVLAANLRGLEPWSDTPGAISPGSLVGTGDGTAFLTYGPTAIVRLSGAWGLQLDVESAVRAKNIAVGTVWRIGVTYQK